MRYFIQLALVALRGLDEFTWLWGQKTELRGIIHNALVHIRSALLLLSGSQGNPIRLFFCIFSDRCRDDREHT